MKQKNHLNNRVSIHNKTWVTIGIIALIIIVILVIIHLRYKHIVDKKGLIAVASISSDGYFAFTTDNENHAILWDIKEKKKISISNQAEVYSAYWIKNTSYFMWQEKNDQGNVFVENADTLKINSALTMKVPYMIFGQAMSSDFHHYVMSDANWTIFSLDGKMGKFLVRNYNDVPGFEGGGKLINFTFLGNDKLLTSGLTYSSVDDPSKANGVDLWDLKTRKKIRSYIGNIGKTFATLSPDGKYVVAGDEGSSAFVWEAQTGKPYLAVDDLFFGNGVQIFRDDAKNPSSSDKQASENYLLKWNLKNAAPDINQIPKAPHDIRGEMGGNDIISLKFIDQTHYLMFINTSHYAVLFQITDPKPIKYFDLGKHPMPSISYYERDQSIDTSPSAHILVMGKDTKPGILVYQYDPDKQTLTKIADLE